MDIDPFVNVRAKTVLIQTVSPSRKKLIDILLTMLVFELASKS